jgi:hypothetical protein
VTTTASIKILKSFSYRGVARTYSNRYHLTGSTPPDSGHWSTLADAIVAAEKLMHLNTTTIVEAIGYAPGSEVPVFTKAYSQAGSLSPAGFPISPGDCALMVRYSTAARTSKNHPVYLFNYYHGVALASSGGDTIWGTQSTAASTYASAWIGAGFSDGTSSYKRAGPNGAAATGELVPTLITHRDLPR